jgi:hypothetical protein
MVMNNSVVYICQSTATVCTTLVFGMKKNWWNMYIPEDLDKSIFYFYILKEDGEGLSN